MLTQSNLQFLNNLSENNNREWFHANRGAYESAKECFETLCQSVLTGVSAFQEDLLNTKVKNCILRINRDVRFSSDKSPYKKYLGAAFGPGGKSSTRADFYLHIQPNDESFIGGGMWSPSASRLAGFRQEIDYNPKTLKGIIEGFDFKQYFNEIHGEKVKTAPKGYSIEHENIELLKYKELFFIHKYTDSQVLSHDFRNEVIKACQVLKPYLDYVNKIYFNE